jgi:[NiFe] hydrogenase diaphorase moiety small subunit
MMVPRFPYQFPVKEIDASAPLIVKDQNRCILCKRCIRTIKDEQGRSYFAFESRGNKLEVVLDKEMAKTMTAETAELAMKNCPVGSILVKEKGFYQPIGTRKFDQQPIGSEISSH